MPGKNKIMVFAAVAVLCALLPGFVHAKRKMMSEPVLLEFKQGEFLAEEYKKKVDDLKEKVSKLKDDKLASKVEELLGTAVKANAKGIAAEVKAGLKKYEKGDPDVVRLVDNIVKDIEDLKFTGGGYAADIKADKIKRKYFVTLDGEGDDYGKAVVKEVPFTPIMYLTISADVVRQSPEAGGYYTYRYWVNNHKNSTKPFRDFFLSAELDYDTTQEELKRVYGKTNKYQNYIIRKINDSKSQGVYYPGEKHRVFTLFFFNESIDIVETYWPGQKTEDPFELEKVMAGLPGIVTAYVEVPLDHFYYLGEVTPEDNPERVVRAVKGSLTSKMYFSPTIGPVPAPEQFVAAEFIDRIISYNEKAIEEGWNDLPVVIKSTREGLASIKKNPSNKEAIKAFLSKLDEYYKKNQILSEAYGLLKLNLEYMLEKL